MDLELLHNIAKRNEIVRILIINYPSAYEEISDEMHRRIINNVLKIAKFDLRKTAAFLKFLRFRFHDLVVLVNLKIPEIGYAEKEAICTLLALKNT